MSETVLETRPAGRGTGRRDQICDCEYPYDRHSSTSVRAKSALWLTIPEIFVFAKGRTPTPPRLCASRQKSGVVIPDDAAALRRIALLAIIDARHPAGSR
jgi:hypothetical protein